MFYNSTRNGYVLPWNWNQSNPCTTTNHDHPWQTPGKSNMLISRVDTAKAPILSLPWNFGFFALWDCWKTSIYSIPHPLWIFEQGHHIQNKTPYIQQIQATSSPSSCNECGGWILFTGIWPLVAYLEKRIIEERGEGHTQTLIEKSGCQIRQETRRKKMCNVEYVYIYIKTILILYMYIKRSNYLELIYLWTISQSLPVWVV